MKIRVFDGGKGDCLLLSSDNDDHILVDGDLVSTFGHDSYSANVADRLNKLRKLGHELVSHNRRAIADAIAASQVGQIALSAEIGPGPLDEFMDTLATSMNEAVQVSRLIGDNQLAIPLNGTFDKKLVMERPESKDMVRGAFRVSVLGPTEKQLIALRKEWQQWLGSDLGRRHIDSVRREAARHEDLLGNGELVQFIATALGPAIGDRTTVTEANVASIIMLVEEGGQNILLTGDARDDHVHEALEKSGRTDADGHIHLNVLKLQHHASKNNFSEDFAKKVTADHYLLYGNGGHHNPHKEVVKRLIDSRIGPASKRSPNPQVGDRFKLWFSADSGSEDANADHMRELEDLVEERAAASGGQMKFRFNRNRSFEFVP
ncbi:MAG: hypothetical protein ACI8Y4_003379 [Candidatus Poriferisodalaceae bacterium]|jgi:hypothetical protein